MKLIMGNKNDKERKFIFHNKEYTWDENPIKFLIGGFITISTFIVLFSGMIFVFGTLVTTFSSVIIQIISVILLIIGLITILGVLKYVVTGTAQPFMKIETGDGRFSVSYLTRK